MTTTPDDEREGPDPACPKCDGTGVEDADHDGHGFIPLRCSCVK